jgi:V-type H+-transporting ATPase proteolipid subunit
MAPLNIALCPPGAPMLGFGGAAIALVFSCIGSAWGTGRAGMGISQIGTQKPEVRTRERRRRAAAAAAAAAARAPRRRARAPARRPTPSAPAPQLVMKNIIPVVMAGVLGIYGLIIAVIIGSTVAPLHVGKPYSLYSGFAHLAAGCCCGFSAVAAGVAIGIVGDAGVRAVAHHNCAAPARLYVGMVLILIFAEALGLYGLIVGLIMSSNLSKGEESC